MEKTLPNPLNTNPTTDEDRMYANAELPDIAALEARVAALEKSAVLLANVPSVTGDYAFRVSASGSNKTYGWTKAADGSLPAVPAAEGAYNLSVADDEGDTVVTWAAVDSGAEE